MSFAKVPTGKDTPNDIYVIVENSKHTPHVKYEVDKDSDALFVDRFAPMPMVFPAHYGYINNTLGGDGDPVDAFVYTDIPVVPGSVIRCRPVAVLNTEDESGMDEKLVCVPVKKLDPRFENIQGLDDLDTLFKKQLEQFYENYKNLEDGKWVKLSGWGDVDVAKDIIMQGVERYKSDASAA